MRTLGFTRLVGSLGAIANQTVWTLPFDQDGRPGEPGPLVEADGGGAAFSPRGDWVAYRAGAGTASQLQVQPFPPTGAIYPVTEQGGSYPAWAPDGRRLIYRRPAPQGGTSQVLVGVDVTTDAGFAWGDETVEPLDNFLSYFGYRDYDFFPDGERLVINVPVTVADSAANEPEQLRINVALNWFEELRERVPVE